MSRQKKKENKNVFFNLLSGALYEYKNYSVALLH